MPSPGAPLCGDPVVVSTDAARLLRMTATLGSAGVWSPHLRYGDPAEAAEHAAEHARLVSEHGPRFLCGLGIGHAPLVERVVGPGAYQKPLEVMSSYLDGLDAAPAPLAREDRVLAALGPKMLEIARTRAAGSHPYLVTPELTAAARQGVGPEGLVACEQAVVLETDPSRARAIARAHTSASRS